MNPPKKERKQTDLNQCRVFEDVWETLTLDTKVTRHGIFLQKIFFR